jgi:hypothetical protein
MAFQGRRVHVGPHEWLSNGAATDYWFVAGASDEIVAASSTNPSGLDGWGWIVTSISSGADGNGNFNSSTATGPFVAAFSASGSILWSPQIFGDYSNFQRVAGVLGYSPTTLICEIRFRFTTASANEPQTFIGFNRSTVSATDTASAGCFYSDGTSFRFGSPTGTLSGSAINLTWHTGRIEVTSTTTSAYIDGVSLGSLNTSTGNWPTTFQGRTSTTNRMYLAWVHIWYQ